MTHIIPSLRSLLVVHAAAKRTAMVHGMTATVNPNSKLVKFSFLIA